MKAAIQLKRSIAATSIVRIIIGKFPYWEKPSSAVLFIVDKSPEIGFHCTILLFCLLVRLGVESGKKSLLDA